VAQIRVYKHHQAAQHQQQFGGADEAYRQSQGQSGETDQVIANVGQRPDHKKENLGGLADTPGPHIIDAHLLDVAHARFGYALRLSCNFEKYAL
jgi:hypothetical protein